MSIEHSPLRSVPSSGAAKVLGVSVRTLEKWRSEGGGPKFVKMSHRCVRYRMCDLQEFQESHLRADNMEVAS